MYEPKFTENNDEFATDTVIEFNTECPHCKKTNFQSIVTRVIKDTIAFQCIHCEQFFVIQYYAFPPTKFKGQDSIFNPFHFGVYKCDKEPTDTDRSFAVFEYDED
jgi:hypothetical protein